MQPVDIPLRFHPVYQPYLWGGDKLRGALGRDDAPAGRVAESWEITDRPDGMSVVREGPLAGKSLRELIDLQAAAVLGAGRVGRFPLLIKVLDAAQTLSVQVHPHDRNVASCGGEAKTETWWILEAEADACVYCGLREEVTADAFARAVAEEKLEPLLRRIPVRAGDAIYVPGGRVHAIASGCLLLEVQQNSNTTYRIYDWGRRGDDGHPRELHLEQAMRVIDWEDRGEPRVAPLPLPPLAGLAREELVRSPYFVLEKLTVDRPGRLPDSPQGFQVFFAVDGALRLTAGGESVCLPAGSSALLPAAARGAELAPEAGPARAIRITAP